MSEFKVIDSLMTPVARGSGRATVDVDRIIDALLFWPVDNRTYNVTYAAVRGTVVEALTVELRNTLHIELGLNNEK